MGQILIIEDEQPLADLLTWGIRQEGHEVLSAANASDGIECGLAKPPDLLIADWMLRHSMHGGQVCRFLRAEYPAMKTIVITGHPEIVSHLETWRDSIDAVIEKPFHLRFLLATVRQLLRQEECSLTTV